MAKRSHEPCTQRAIMFWRASAAGCAEWERPMAEPPSPSDRHRGAPQSDLLLTTKFSLPPPRPRDVQRQRLLERLSEATGHKLTLVSAPAGFGKTTLLAEWCASSIRRELPVACLSLDERDDDPVRFWSYVIA